ncbi:MAG: glutamine synthetase [Desulfovibrio sp.]|nr:glutamine synthetase [Desulfovibrio sp.]
MARDLVFDLKTPEEVIKVVRDNTVRFIQFWFVDVLGDLKSFEVTPSELTAAFAEGMGFDGSSIHGFARVEESDMLAMPEASTFQILPWRGDDYLVARVFCDILKPDRTPYEGDSRYILKKVLRKAAEGGYTFYLGPELEFFLFSSNKEPACLDVGGYFDAPHVDLGVKIRREIICALEDMGIEVEYSHHEVASSQHEIDLRYQEALRMADVAVTYRIICKEIAARHGCYASFMPKPVFGINGSGMHVHQSLFKDGKNVFFDAADPFHLSREAKGYIAGLLRHSREICCVTNQWINSYKRLVPGYEAPTYIAWARRNRSTLVRVPMYKPGKENATRVELRSPDPACNPYLAFAVMLAAGFKGMEEGYDLPDPIESNIYEMDRRALAENGIGSLPDSLYEAAREMADSELVKETLGDHIHEKLYQNKMIDCSEYNKLVTKYEIREYLQML